MFPAGQSPSRIRPGSRHLIPAGHHWRFTGWLARGLLAALLALIGGYFFFIVQQYRAWAWAQSERSSEVARAVALRPSSADYHQKLGTLLLYSDGNPAQAAREFTAATRLEPDSARPWLMLAGSDFALGDMPGFRSALERASRLDPTTPDLAWQAGNYWLSSGDTDRALRAFHTVLLYDNSKLPRAVQVAWQATRDVNRVLDTALPASPDAYAALLAVLTREPDAIPAERVWAALVGLNQPVAPRSVFPYLDYLLQHGKSLEAQRAWVQLLELNSLGALLGGDNLLTDGGFEGESFHSGGFFWQIAELPGIQTSVDGETAHGGSRSLLLTLDNATGTDLGVFQVVPLQANARYLLRGFVRAEELRTAYGPQLSVVDHFTGQPLAQSDEVIGTTGWRELRVSFTVPASTRAVEVRLERAGAGVIAGKLWLDDLSLVQP